MLENFLIGASGSFTASIIFIYFLFRYLRPRILVAPNIAKRINERGVPAYTFKIINETAYPVVDIRIEIVLYTPRNIANGQVNDATPLWRLDRFQLDSSKELTEPFGNEAYYTLENLEDRWNDDKQHLVFRVMVRHSLTQFCRVFSQSYYRKGSCIKLGQFSNGPSLDVVAEG